MSWYNETYRKLFFDFHSPGAAKGLASRFDAEQWADRLQRAHVQAVSVFTKCGYGYSFYRQGCVRYPHPHLPAGLDMMAAQIGALHRRGMRAIGYYHTFNSEPIAAAHPDWLECDPDGKPRARQICMLGPVLEEWMLPHLEEVLSLYELDSLFFDGTRAVGVCTCPACRAQFAGHADGAAIPRSPADPAWGRYVAWKVDAFRSVRERICATIHAVRPDLVVSFNWAYAPRNPESVPAEVGALVADIQPQDQTFEGSYLSSYWALEGKPFDVMNSAFLQWWGDWGCKPALAMEQEVAGALANGGLTWIGYQMNEAFDVEPAVMDELGKTLAFVEEREPLLRDAEPVCHVAVLHSLTAGLVPGSEQFRVEEATLRGAHRALLERMVPHHLVHEPMLLANLERFQVVILPDVEVVGPELAAALRSWVENGGVLLATGRTGLRDTDLAETGTFALQEILGVRYEGMYDQPHAYIEVTDARLKPNTLDMPHLAEAPFALVSPCAPDVEVPASLRRIYLREDGGFLLRWSPVGEDSGHPAITLRRVGRGHAAYLAGNVFRAYQVKNQWNLKHIVANLLDALVAEPPVSVVAPAWLHVVPRRQPPAGERGERLIVHLTNPHGNRPVDGNYCCVEALVPIPDITVRVRCCRQPRTVTLEPGGECLAWSYAEGVLTCTVPEVHVHRAICIELPPENRAE